MADYGETPITDPDSISYVALTGSIAAGFSGATDDLLIDYTNKRIALKASAGTNVNELTSDGITLKAVYSKLKDAWQSDTSDSGENVLIRFPFPMVPITDEQFQLVEGWNWDKTQTSGDGTATTVELIRTGGWQVVNASNQVTEEWAGIISLGDLPASTQVYYDQKNDETTASNTVDFKLTQKVNQAVQIYNDVDGDGVIESGDGDYNYRSYFKMFVREWKRTFAVSAFSDIGVTTATYQAYRFPLTNSADLKVPHAEALVAGTGIATSQAESDGTTHTYTVASGHGITAGEKISVTGHTPAGFNVTDEAVTGVTSTTITVTPTSPVSSQTDSSTGLIKMPVFDNMSITYARATDDSRVVISDIKGTHDTGGVSYVVGDVVQSATNSEWYIVIQNHTSTATDPSADSTNFAAYDFDREISVGSDNYYAFNVSVDGDTQTANYNDGAANTQEIYEFTQYKLRQNSDIDDASPGTVIGKTADQLLSFVGDTLVTSTGVYVDSFESEDINSIDFTDYTGTVRRYDFVAFLRINFGQNLIDDTAAIYKVFFTTSDDGNFGQSTAELVETNTTGTFMEGTVNGASSVNLSFNYDGNVQRGGGTGGTDANITAVAIGLTKGQYVKTTGTIARSKTNSVSLVAALERNYQE